MKTLNERMDVKPTKTRAEIKGWTKKDGQFSIAITLPVLLRIKRTTRMSGSATRESGSTVIRGYVSDGVSPRWQRVIFLVLIAMCLAMVLAQQFFLAVASLTIGVATYIPMMGDYRNSDVLLIEVERLLKASPRPPKFKKK
jgi:hypothetical protein